MNETDPLMQQITAALERAPIVRVPEDFADRLMALIPQQKRSRIVAPALAPARYGQLAMLVAMLVVLAATFAFAPAARSNTGRIVEFAMLAELAALALWYARLRRT